MSTTLVNQTPRATSGRARRRRPFGLRRAVLVASTVVTALALAGTGGWFLADRASGSQERSGPPAPVAVWSGAPSWLERLPVAALQRQLVRQGYSLAVDGRLDPVTKSALADFLRPSSVHPLSPWLAAVLRGTVLNGRRDQVAWNRRFGRDRERSVVELPLTGPGGQLDDNGNIRPARG